ncbi:DUF427 domain-containing protein [Salinarimonas ramus]|uniref:DUF427 domain-containing protein n=1 Tax=Salinarimonas ramus TaxID=690164 RepID=A0A917QJ77_9HYPH|nr:DUF427 domain-containing protein [Salinarimonas ramus]GGK53065.1 hypothetical protein GCM10011322_44930 [Salinarimonas ramus]
MMKEPGPDHPITVRPAGKRVRVVLGGAIVAETDAALRLEENLYPPVFYIPRADIEMDLLAPSPKRTHCPYKGEASYFTVSGHGIEARDAAWSYETPYPALKEIEGLVAFDRAKVDAIEELS